MTGLCLLYTFLRQEFKDFCFEWKQSCPFPTSLHTMTAYQNVLFLSNILNGKGVALLIILRLWFPS